MRVQQHFWELREKRDRRELEKLKIKNPKLKLKKLNNLEFQEFWVPLKKIEGTVFSLEGREINLKKIWEIFEEYKFYKERRDEVSFVLEGAEKALEEEITSFKEIKPDVSGELVEEVLKKIKEAIRRKKGEIIRKYYYGCDSIKSKRLFLFISIKRTGLEEAEVSYFVGDIKEQKVKAGNRIFHRVPERAVAFLITLDGRDKVVPRYIFELP